MKIDRSASIIFFSYFIFSLFSLHALSVADSSELECTVQQEVSPTTDNPPSTLLSGKTKEIEINGDDPILEKYGHYSVFRYGAVSDGPVLIDVFGKDLKWFIQISDMNETLLGEASGVSDLHRGSITVPMKAGNAILITIGGLIPEGSGTLEITLVEANRSEGLSRIKDTIKKAQALKLKSQQEWKADNPEMARELIREALIVMDQCPGCMQSAPAIDFIKKEIGGFAYQYLRDYETAERAWVLAEQFLKETIPHNHRDLLATQMNIAVTYIKRNRFLEAKSILIKIVQRSKVNQSTESSILPDASLNLGIVYQTINDLDKAKELYTQAIEGFKHKHKDPNWKIKLQTAHFNLGSIYLICGDLAKAQQIFDDTLRIYENEFHQDNSDIQIVKLQIAIALKRKGFPHKALPLFENVLDVYKRKLSADDPDLQLARMYLADTMCSIGDTDGARVIYEEVLQIYKQTLAHDNPRMQEVKRGIAATMFDSGDYEGAREILENVLGTRDMSSHSESQNELLDIRLIYGSTLYELEEYEAARDIFTDIVSIYEHKSQKDYITLQHARMNLGLTLWQLGELQKARDLFAEALSCFERELPSDHPEIHDAEWNLAIIDWELGDLQTTKNTFEELLDKLVTVLPAGHPDLQAVRGNLAYCLLELDFRNEAIDLIKEALTETLQFISRIILTGAVREIDQAVNQCRWILDRYLSLGYEGVFSHEECFTAVEPFRAAGTRVGIIRKTIIAEGNETIKKLHEDYFRACEQVASSEKENFNKTWRNRARSERILAEGVTKLAGVDEICLKYTPREIASFLPEGWVGISYFRYVRNKYQDKEGESGIKSSPNYIVFILHHDGQVDCLNLGNARVIDQFVKSWKKELEEGTANTNSSSAREIKRHIWNPVRRRLKNNTKLLIAPDFELATIPFEAIPEGSGVVNDSFTVAYIESLSNLTIARNDTYDDESGLLVFGGVNYDEEPVLYTEDEYEKSDVKKQDYISLPIYGFSSAPRSNGDALSRYLPGSETEGEAVEEIYKSVFKRDAIFLKGAEASKFSLLKYAPRSRYLHIATHGYYAREYVKSPLDILREDEKVSLSTMKTRVRSLAPSRLCGIKLAGSNLPVRNLQDEGVITAEEIQALDLSQCELAVLSACESGLGIARSGQGIMSLQRALTIAGARGSITSLWRVEDNATCLLFAEYYRLMWEKNMQPAEALRQAKWWLRNLKAGEIDEWKRHSSSPTVRGLNPPASLNKLSKSHKLYENPVYWAAFVYWGHVK